MMADLGRSAIIIGLAYRAGCGAGRVWPPIAASRHPSSIVLVLGLSSTWGVGGLWNSEDVDGVPSIPDFAHDALSLDA